MLVTQPYTFEHLMIVESPESDPADRVAAADDIMRCASHATVSSHHPRFQSQNAVDHLQHPSLTLSGIEPTISEEEESDQDSDTNGLLFCTYRSFKDDDDEDPDLPKVIGKVRVNEGVKDVRVNRKVRDDATIRINDRSKQQNKDTKFKVNDGVKDNGKVRDNGRTYGDADKDSQRVHHCVRVDNEKGKKGRASKRGGEDGQSNTETSSGREDQYVKLGGGNEAVEWHQGTIRTQRKNGRRSIKSTLCVVS